MKSWRASGYDGFADLWTRHGARLVFTTRTALEAWLERRRGLRLQRFAAAPAGALLRIPTLGSPSLLTFDNSTPPSGTFAKPPPGKATRVGRNENDHLEERFRRLKELRKTAGAEGGNASEFRAVFSLARTEGTEAFIARAEDEARKIGLLVDSPLTRQRETASSVLGTGAAEGGQGNDQPTASRAELSTDAIAPRLEKEKARATARIRHQSAESPSQKTLPRSR